MTQAEQGRGIALALSGGGVRAMVFHAGVLRWMAERDLLERVTRISTVSGGSLLTGLIFQFNGMKWPSSSEYLTHVYPQLRAAFCERSLMWGAFRQLLNPLNWRFLLSRANLLGLALRKEWQIQAPLSALPRTPEWSINGTTAENGKRFRFKAGQMGDYELGYAEDCHTFPLANAMAVSAAFPGLIGPLTLRADSFEWKKRRWGTTPGSEQVVTLPFRNLHLYDGGVYDNLGLEPLFDAGRQRSKVGDECIVASDAGLPLAPGFESNPLNIFRLRRITDVMSEQVRSLRVRAFSNFLQGGKARGAFLYIAGPNPEEPDAEALYAMRFPTSLSRLSVEQFERLAEHGRSVAQAAEDNYGALCSKEH
ncbi:patatin-like phospholipase family protein [Roseateles sp. BYS78W]|uniref:Patatin-like phospholipase family protein n=1 Tax=Pelomonas candidula TaxID=3299025 RepID=A0ABW7HL23_9BURK